MDAAQPLNEIKANLFKGLAHPVRIRVLELLAESDQLAVAELVAQTGLEPSHLSQHLGVLRRYQLVTSQRQASTVYYRLASRHVADLLQVARELLTETLHTTTRQLRDSTSDPSDPSRR